MSPDSRGRWPPRTASTVSTSTLHTYADAVRPVLGSRHHPDPRQQGRAQHHPRLQVSATLHDGDDHDTDNDDDDDKDDDDDDDDYQCHNAILGEAAVIQAATVTAVTTATLPHSDTLVSCQGV